MAIITIPKILQEKLTEEGANALVGILDKVEERSEAHTLQVAEERFEKNLEKAKTELREEINKVDKRLEQVKSELKADIANVRADLIKWMFIFWVGQVITITGILITFLKK